MDIKKVEVIKDLKKEEEKVLKNIKKEDNLCLNLYVC